MALANAKQLAIKERAQRVIPGGMYGHESTGLLPENFPQFLARAKGARMWDLDGNEYIDYLCAYGPNLFGYGYEPIEEAARAQAELGDTLTAPSAAMVDLAEAFVEQVSHADWAKFCKNGTDATSMAIVTARAFKGRRKILCAEGAYHGAAHWCTPIRTGTVAEDRAHIVFFQYNDPQSLEDAFKANEGDVAGVIATPFRHEVFSDQFLPDPEYARLARRLCDEADALLIVDDVRAGFRIARDCSWEKVGVRPDLSCWGKCFANGHPISALLGSDKARDAAISTFVTGSFWFSAVPMAAGVRTLREIRDRTADRSRTAGTATWFRSPADGARDNADVPVRRGPGLPYRLRMVERMPRARRLFPSLSQSVRIGGAWRGRAKRYAERSRGRVPCGQVEP